MPPFIYIHTSSRCKISKVRFQLESQSFPVLFCFVVCPFDNYFDVVLFAASLGCRWIHDEKRLVLWKHWYSHDPPPSPPHSLVLEDKEGRLWCVSPSFLGVSEYLCTEICTSRQKRFSLVTFVDSPGLVDGDMKYPFDVDEVILWLGGLPLTDLCCRHTVVIKGPLRHLWLLVFWQLF